MHILLSTYFIMALGAEFHLMFLSKTIKMILKCSFFFFIPLRSIENDDEFILLKIGIWSLPIEYQIDFCRQTFCNRNV